VKDRRRTLWLSSFAFALGLVVAAPFWAHSKGQFETCGGSYGPAGGDVRLELVSAKRNGVQVTWQDTSSYLQNLRSDDASVLHTYLLDLGTGDPALARHVDRTVKRRLP